MTPALRAADRVTRLAPLGLRFVDPLTQSTIDDGLQVTLWPLAQPWRIVRTRPNASGIHVLHDGPGLGRAARGAGDERYWAAPPESCRYRGEVSDPRGRFHAVSFGAELPFRGLFAPDCAFSSPPPAAAGIELFSTPSRPLPGGLAVVRAELSRVDSGAAAAWALLAAEYGGRIVGRGLADRGGRVVLAFAFPEPAGRATRSPPAAASPPGGQGALLAWEVRLRVFHAPQLAAEPLPDYCAVVQQPEAQLLLPHSPFLPLEATTVLLGRESVYPVPGTPRLLVAPI